MFIAIMVSGMLVDEGISVRRHNIGKNSKVIVEASFVH